MKTSKFAAVVLSSMTLAGVTAIAAGVAAPANASAMTVASSRIGHDHDGDRVKNDNDLDNRNVGRNDGRNDGRNEGRFSNRNANWQRQNAVANNRNRTVQNNRQWNKNENRNEIKKQRHRHHRHHRHMPLEAGQ